MRRAKTDVRATIDAAKSQKRREVEEHEHRLAAEAQSEKKQNIAPIAFAPYND